MLSLPLGNNLAHHRIDQNVTERSKKGLSSFYVADTGLKQVYCYAQIDGILNRRMSASVLRPPPRHRIVTTYLGREVLEKQNVCS